MGSDPEFDRASATGLALVSERAPVRVLSITAFLYPFFAIFAPKGLVILLGLAALLTFVAPANRRGFMAGVSTPVTVALGALLVWALVTTIWVPMSLRSLALWLRILALVVAGLCLAGCVVRLDSGDRESASMTIGLSGALFVAVFLFELATGGILSSSAITIWNHLTPWDSPQRYHGSFLASASAALVVFVWPSALGLARRTSVWWAAAFLIVAGVALLGQNMTGAKIAFVAAGIAGAMMWRWPRFAGIAVVVGLITANIVLFVVVYSRGAPGLVGWLADALSMDILPLPWQERIHIVAFSLERVALRPWFGWGFDASRMVSEGIVGPFHGNPALPLHPHNLWLQIWLELGLIGVALALALVGMVVKGISEIRADPMAAAAAIATVVSYLVVGNISFGAWQNWWLAIAWLGAGFMVALLPRQTAERS